MQRRSLLLTALAGAAAGRHAWAADEFPVRPVKVIRPFAAGGGPDVQMRQMAPKFGEALGGSVVVENKVGAGGVLGAQTVMQAPPDGYTLMLGASTLQVQKAMQPELKFDVLQDFTAVAPVSSSATVLVVDASSPVKSFEDLLRLARANPGKLNYGSGGIGTSAHLAGATIVALSRLQATHIPLRGSVEMAPSLRRGDTQFGCPIAGTAVPQVKQGLLRALAVTSRKRLKELPDVPTLQELLQSELAVQETWFGLLAPSGTPAAVVARLHAAASRALADAGLRGAFEASGSEAVTSDSPASFAAYVRKENARWADIVKLTGVKGT